MSGTASWPLLTNEGECEMPLKETVDEDKKPLPFTVSVNDVVPAMAEDGDKLVIEG